MLVFEKPLEEVSYGTQIWVAPREDQADGVSRRADLEGQVAQYDFHSENAWDELSPLADGMVLLFDMDLCCRLRSAILI